MRERSRREEQSAINHQPSARDMSRRSGAAENRWLMANGWITAEVPDVFRDCDL